MGLTTLSDTKTALGISGTGEDTALTQWIRTASWLIRSYIKYKPGGVITSNSAVSPTVVTSPGHGLKSNDTIVIAGSNSTASIDGSQTVTRVDDDTFSVAVDCTSGAGTAGFWAQTFTEYYSGNNRSELILRNRPVQSITTVNIDSDGYYGQGSSAFPSGDDLTEGTDFVLARDNGDSTEVSSSGIIYKISGIWPAATSYTAGLLAANKAPGVGNIKVVYTAGYAVMPYDLQAAAQTLVAEMRRSMASGGPMQSEAIDYYNYVRASADEQNKLLTSVRGMLKKYREWLW